MNRSIPKSAVTNPKILGTTAVVPCRPMVTYHNLIVLPSDKNLGVTCVTKDWFIDQTQMLLQSPKDYIASSFNDCIILLHQTAVMAKETLLDWSTHSEAFRSERQLRSFLWEGITPLLEEESDTRLRDPLFLLDHDEMHPLIKTYSTHIPQFYGVTKDS